MDCRRAGSYDDIMLGVLPVVLRATQPTYEHKHHFVCATSSVSNPHMLELLDEIWHDPQNSGRSKDQRGLNPS